MRSIAKTLLKSACILMISVLAAGAQQQEDQYQEGIQYLNFNDYEKGYEILKPLAEQGHARAQTQIGHLYHAGQGVERDYDRARYWYRQAADRGDARAQFHLAKLYFEGRGVPQDYRRAWRWFREAGERGYAPAQYRLGLMYELSQGVLQDYKKAARWYLEAARQGLPQAQFLLADLYYKGQGVERDIVQAHMWVNLAVAATQPANKDYNDMVALRDKLEKMMDDEQVLTARNKMKNWEPEQGTGS